MKNARRDLEIKVEDFNSIFLWKVFWKLLKRENPLYFFLKAILLGLSLAALIFSLILVGDLLSA